METGWTVPQDLNSISLNQGLGGVSKRILMIKMELMNMPRFPVLFRLRFVNRSDIITV